LQIMLV